MRNNVVVNAGTAVESAVPVVDVQANKAERFKSILSRDGRLFTSEGRGDEYNVRRLEQELTENTTTKAEYRT
jgi:hypothetical protein